MQLTKQIITDLGNTWHAKEEKAIFEVLQSDEAGLTNEEAEKRIAEFGPNELPQGAGLSLFKIILNQILNPLIFILLAAAVASVLVGEVSDSFFILLVIAINSALGAYQEYNAEKSASGLKNLLKIKARVKRNEKEHEISSEKVVPGDIVTLESGLKVPADMRLLTASNLAIDESFLTGESMTAQKETGTLEKGEGVSERTNMAFAGSTVISGRGTGIVVGTGLETQVGKIALNVTESESAKPPLVLRMEKFIKQIGVFTIVLSVLLGMLMRYQGEDWASIFFFIVALAVSAIPEGLPVALTVVLSIATKRMVKRNVIVRQLNSVESLGSCTVIASDKTGTLTVNEQTAKKILLPNAKEFNISGEGYNGDGKVTEHGAEKKELEADDLEHIKAITKIGILANEASLTMEGEKWVHFGDAMDVALLGMGEKVGLKKEAVLAGIRLLDVIPYESERKFSASFVEEGGKTMVSIKGAVETIVQFCHKISENGNLTDLDKNKIITQADELAEKGYRVLAFASGEFPDYAKKRSYSNEELPNMVFYGLVGFIDPLRQEAKLSVDECKTAGIKVLMITGDHPSTAKTISTELGIADEATTVITGKMLEEAGDYNEKPFADLVNSTTVFARVSPTQKYEIVDVLIKSGEFVAVTGDGVNDAPALKRANIGVAMGSGTDVAKEVGSMIIVDDNFSSIVAGVEEGRYAYANVRKVVYLLISTGAAEVIMFIPSILLGLPLPLLAVQLLWLNLATNGIQHITLAFEAGEPGTMQKKPRQPNEKMFNPLMVKQTLISASIMGGISFATWFYLIDYVGMAEASARNIVLLLMVFMENFHVFNCRSETTSAFHIPISKNYFLLLGVAGAQGIHVLSMQIPFMQETLRIEPISLTDWLMVLAFGVPIFLGMEVFKYFNKSR